MLNVPELFRKSVYSPEFYRSLLEQPFSFSLKYFYSLVFALAIALTLIFALTALPAAYRFLKDLGPRMEAEYPADLVIEITGGEAKMNRTEPFKIPFPEELRAAARASGIPASYLLVVDPSAEYRLDRFREYDTFIWFAKHELAYADRENDIRTRTLEGVDARIDRTLVLEAARAVEGFVRWAPLWFWLFTLVMLGVFVILLSGQLGYLLIGAVLVLLILKLRGIEAGYKKSYQIGLHAVSIGVVIDAVGLLAGGAPEWLGMLAMAIIVWLNFDPVPPVPVAESV